MRPIRMHVVFLAMGGARLKVYDTPLETAEQRGGPHLPHEAKEVYEEILKLRAIANETTTQRQERVDKVFEDLEMGRLPHSAPSKNLSTMLKDAKVEMPCADIQTRCGQHLPRPQKRGVVKGLMRANPASRCTPR